MAIGGNHMRVVFAARLDPHLQDVMFIRRGPCDESSVGRDSRVGTLRVPEQNFARNKGRQFGSRLERVADGCDRHGGGKSGPRKLSKCRYLKVVRPTAKVQSGCPFRNVSSDS